jgi:MFS family permease
MSNSTVSKPAWHTGVTRQQWLLLAIASAGWMFDTFEGQIFNLTRNQMLGDILGARGSAGNLNFYGDAFIGVFLLGGTAGGLLFGTLADRWGRRPTMIVTILVYSIFSGMTFFARSLWEVAALRFLVALGVGGEWAVAASLVAEAFPIRARPHASGIFHATSIFGTWMAALAGLAVGVNWRYGYLIGLAPALLVLWVRAGVEESASWASEAAKRDGAGLGSFRELLGDPRWGRRAILGMLLAAAGLGAFWCVTVAGQNLANELLLREGVAKNLAASRAKFAYGIVETAGGGLGLLSFGPLCARFGRKPTFLWMQGAALLITPALCYGPRTYGQMLCLLPVFGFFTLSIHAGYAIYFPELFPTRLRATGTGFCFNGGRILAAPLLWFSGWLKALPGMDLRLAVTLLGLLFAFGMAIVPFLPETKDQPLPE